VADARPAELIGQALGLRVAVLNDADAAGLAEVRFGAARGREGTVVLVTLGTGIGTALCHDGILVPNAELARVRIKGKEAQQKASDAARKRRGVSWEQWASDVEAYLAELEQIIWPDLVLGGVSAGPTSSSTISTRASMSGLLASEQRRHHRRCHVRS
jgi:polyphosphate glucokinase